MGAVVVTGIGLTSALGDLKSSWEGLLGGNSGIKLYQPFQQLPPYPMALINKKESDLISSSSLTDLTDLTEQLVEASLEDAHFKSPLPDMGVVIGSSRSCQGLWEKLAVNFYRARSRAHEAEYNTIDEKDLTFAPFCAQDWLLSLPGQGAIAAAQKIGTEGPVLAPMTACATGIWALFYGYEWIKTGKCQQVLAGAVETPITPLTLAGFERMKALAKTGCYPFDRGREGLVLGEGGALFVLETLEKARERKAKIYGEILGFGLTADGYHVSAPEIEGKSAVKAIKNCLTQSHLSEKEINYIHAHGTSTLLNDRNESKLVQHLFPERVAISSTKGATGHTLGASGAIGTAFTLLAIKEQIVPPCVGLNETEFDLNLVKKAAHQKINSALVFSFGFGGQNAIIAVGKTRNK